MKTTQPHAWPWDWQGFYEFVKPLKKPKYKDAWIGRVSWQEYQNYINAEYNKLIFDMVNLPMNVYTGKK